MRSSWYLLSAGLVIDHWVNLWRGGLLFFYALKKEYFFLMKKIFIFFFYKKKIFFLSVNLFLDKFTSLGGAQICAKFAKNVIFRNSEKCTFCKTAVITSFKIHSGLEQCEAMPPRGPVTLIISVFRDFGGVKNTLFFYPFLRPRWCKNPKKWSHF